jgi:hypothetical protein
LDACRVTNSGAKKVTFIETVARKVCSLDLPLGSWSAG